VTEHIEPLRPDLAGALARFFDELRANGDEVFFHPHPLTLEEAELRAGCEGSDVYLAAVDDAGVIGYGMLRGWDEGYQIPSVGIAISPRLRGSGLARRLMEQLHAIAWDRGAERVRLTVARENQTARQLFESLGYKFTSPDELVLVGYLDRPAA
jgi:ribosomal protein S18 acetylase RimI-like enzyme